MCRQSATVCLTKSPSREHRELPGTAARLAALPDPRARRGRRHSLASVLLTAACAVLAGEGPRVFRTAIWPSISRSYAQPRIFGVRFAWRAVTHRRVKAFAIVPEFDVASDVLPSGLAGQVSHP